MIQRVLQAAIPRLDESARRACLLDLQQHVLDIAAKCQALQRSIEAKLQPTTSIVQRQRLMLEQLLADVVDGGGGVCVWNEKE